MKSFILNHFTLCPDKPGIRFSMLPFPLKSDIRF